MYSSWQAQLMIICITDEYMTLKTSGNYSGVFRDRTSLNTPKWLLAAEYGYVIQWGRHYDRREEPASGG